MFDWSGFGPTEIRPAHIAGDPALDVAMPVPAGSAVDITGWFGSAAPTVGQKTMAASLPVVIASDQTALPVAAVVAGAVDVSDRVGRLLGVVASITNPVAVTGTFFQATQPISAAALPLPAGASTSALQGGGLPAALVGGRLDVNIGASGITIPVSLAAAVDVSDRVGRLLGVVASITNPVAVTGTFFQATQPVSIAATVQVDVTDEVGRVLGIVSTAQLPAALVGGRLNVNLGASGITLPISAAALPLPAGASTSALQGGGLPAALVGGRLDVNLGAWLGSTAPTVGQKAMAASLPVAIASDQSAVPISGTVSATQGTTPWETIQGTASMGTISLLASAVRAATTVSAVQTNPGASGILLRFDVTAVPGVSTVQLRLDARITGVSVLYNLAFTATAATGTFYYIIRPGTTTTDYGTDITAVRSIAVPGQWRIAVIHAGAGNFTYQVDALLIP